MKQYTPEDHLVWIKKSGIDPHTYVFPYGFWKSGVRQPARKCIWDATKPLTMKTLMESHIATAGWYLVGVKNNTLVRLIETYLSVVTWDPDPVVLTGEILDTANGLLHVETLEILGDRIQYLPRFLQTKDYRTLGLKASELFKPFIEYIDRCGGIGYRDPVNFLANAFEVDVGVDHGAIPYKNGAIPYKNSLLLVPKIENKPYQAAIGGGRHAVASSVQSNMSESSIVTLLLFVYFTQYQQWINDSTTVNVNGTDVYIDHHTVLQTIIRNMIRIYKIEHTPTYDPLPFGTHPSVFYKSLIEIIAEDTLEEIGDTHYPTDEVYDLNIQDPNAHQLLTGMDLYNEGARMKHCVGGEDYREEMNAGTMLFFHFDEFVGAKHGATLALTSAIFTSTLYDVTPHDHLSSHVFVDQYNRGWVVDEFYGYDNEELDSKEQVEMLLTWLNQNFKCVDRYLKNETVG